MAFDPNARLDPSQVEDRRRRGQRGRGGPVIVGGGIGGGIGLLLLIAALLLGVDPFGGEPAGTYSDSSAATSIEQTLQECQTGADANRQSDCRVVGLVNSIQTYWNAEFAGRGWQYQPARTVLFSGAVQAECGYATAAVGPFYCPTDERVYLDLAFFEDLQTRFGASGGPFAEAYVIAHEYGHHVQHQLGLLGSSGASAQGEQGGSVRIELQADCLAGVWAHHASATGYLLPPTAADIAAALDAAAAVGDDRIQQRTQGEISPESWTHGSSQQRQQWFATGFELGDPASCDTARGPV